MPLPFQLDHVNIYVIKDVEGWIIFDTGIDDVQTRQAWETLFRGPMKRLPITGVIVSHSDPDHIGLAGWLCNRFGTRLFTSLSSYLSCSSVLSSNASACASDHQKFYLAHGMSHASAAIVDGMGHQYSKMVSELPQTFKRIIEGDSIHIGELNFVAIFGEGHSPEQVMLYCKSAKVVIVADQVLPKITPNVSVWSKQPVDNPLSWYLRSVRKLQADIPSDVMVLPGHGVPFYGLHERCQQIIEHHEARCDVIYKTCQRSAQSVADLILVLFRPNLDSHQMGFAFGEALAHVNYMLENGRLRAFDSLHSGHRYVAV